jgi:hypothetical protein
LMLPPTRSGFKPLAKLQPQHLFGLASAQTLNAKDPGTTG